MYPSKLLLLPFSLLIAISSKLANPVVAKSYVANAELGTTWENNPSTLQNWSPDDNFSMRLIFPHLYGTARISVGSSVNSVPLFACGFFCAGLAATCDAYIFSIFVVNAFSEVRENATVQLTELGDLVLYDSEGTLVWFTNTTDKSVVGMNLTELGNLVLLDRTNMAVRRSFDHPTDTLVTGQMLQSRQKLIASMSETNWAKGKILSLSVLNDGIYMFAGVDTPLAYYGSPTGTEAPDYHIQLPMDAYGLEFVTGGNGSWVSSDLLDVGDPFSYPLACGEYGICSDEQCSCPDAALRQFLVLPNTTNFNIIYNWTTNEEYCKLSCLNDCSCKIAFFLHRKSSSGFCFLASDTFSMMSAQSDSRNFSSYAFVKVQEHKPVLSKEKIAIILVVGSSTFVASAIVSLLIVLRRKRAKRLQDRDIIDNLPGLPTRFSFESLKSATGDFSRKIGTGGSGSVFKGYIGDKQVAAKRLDGINQGEKELLTEVQTVGSINHLHLVSLIGFCAEKSHRLLPQNILLDEMFSAKVSDFRLAKQIDREQSSVMTRFRGTPGSLAPEWLTSVISGKVDVYSFGIVVMEIMCGRRILDYSELEERQHLVSMLQEKAKDEQLLDLIVPRSTDLELHPDEVFVVMNLALWCLQILEGTMGVETDLDLDLVNIDLMMANRATRLNDVTLHIESILSGPR
ncbi:hypothetical protein BS78_10G161900 [Paspalum vaginatum]|nr:hypothetical protein BS78_10G161900 [Paspalum vaginatum]